jgi:hypothetical protein
MFRWRSVVLALALSTLGWSTAHAVNNKFKIITAVGKSSAATKVIEDLKQYPPTVLRRFYDLIQKRTRSLDPDDASVAQRLENLSAYERGSIILNDKLGLSKSYLEHSGVDPTRYEIKNWKLYLHPPISFALPLRGVFTLDEIDLRKPAIISGGAVCALSQECRKFVGELKAKIGI